MSITNLINENDFTIIQGVNGISLFEESWMKKSTKESGKAKKPIQTLSK